MTSFSMVMVNVERFQLLRSVSTGEYPSHRSVKFKRKHNVSIARRVHQISDGPEIVPHEVWSKWRRDRELAVKPVGTAYSAKEFLRHRNAAAFRSGMIHTAKPSADA